MRVNVYSEELTNEVEVAEVSPAGTERSYIGIRFILKSSPDLHHTRMDDDRSAVTLWVGSASEGRELLTAALAALDSQG